MYTCIPGLPKRCLYIASRGGFQNRWILLDPSARRRAPNRPTRTDQTSRADPSVIPYPARAMYDPVQNGDDSLGP